MVSMLQSSNSSSSSSSKGVDGSSEGSGTGSSAPQQMAATALVGGQCGSRQLLMASCAAAGEHAQQIPLVSD